MPTPSVVTTPNTWNFQQSHVERLMDHAALTSAHPDDTLILAPTMSELNYKLK